MNEDETKIQVTSNNQSGGITAHTVNINATPKPTINANTVYFNQLHGTEFRSRIALMIESPYPLGNLFVAVHALSIKSISLMPQRSGGFMMGNCGNRDGMSFANLQQPQGLIHLDVVTAQPEQLNVEWDLK